MSQTLHILALGDVHGFMHEARKLTIQKTQMSSSPPDLILQVGDFEPHRHDEDLRSMDAPSKYKKLGSYKDFHHGHASFPAPLYFIGGNHEPYAWLSQHPEGFALTPDIHYLGRAGTRHIHHLHITYISGIYQEATFPHDRPAHDAFSHTSNKAWVYFNHLDLDAIFAQPLTPTTDILILHDWPEQLLQPCDAHLFARHGRTLHASPGNPYARLLIDLLAPRLVLCGHMHTRYHHRFTHACGRPCDVLALGHILHHEDAIASIHYDLATHTLTIT